ncbi:MAG: insulinase family protein [Bacilli bacterium]|nr:insulinase family protein [Bacilli bacterium]
MIKDIKFDCYNIKGIPIYVHRETGFNTIQFRFLLLSEYKKEEATLDNLLQAVLFDTSKKYNNKDKKYNKVDDLYAPAMGVSSFAYYEMKGTVFALSTVDPLYLPDNKYDYFKESLMLFKEFIFNSRVKKNKFNDKVLDEKKYLLNRSLFNAQDNYHGMAFEKCFDVMFEGETGSIHDGGYLEDLDKIDSSVLYDYYKDLFNKTEKAIVIAGDFDFSKYEKALYDFLPDNLPNPECMALAYYDRDKEIKEVKEVIEKKDVEQGFLIMGYRFLKPRNKKERATYYILNMMLGGMSSSSFNRIIREKEKLAYHVSSGYDVSDGSVIISTDIAPDNYERVVNLIKDIIKDYQNGNISEELFELVRKTVIEDFDYSDSTLSSRINNFIGMYCGDKDDLFSYGIKGRIEEKIRFYNELTIDDIKEASNRLYLDTIYFVRNEESEENEGNEDD